ncbi:hypothetical protein [Ferrimicrobium acidiphilum]|jgi:hypothetical protein|uniref:hypothetical protein n=1 Tax=Ferrimicrobium acidiphilum TaxID=121039 RepID=UPI0023EFC63B|nr:hypothetical protein [Ferrimicrobium acidiphilum]
MPELEFTSTEYDPFETPVVEEEESPKPVKSRGRPAGKRNQPKVSREVQIAVKVVASPIDVQSLLSKIFNAPQSEPLELVAAVLRDADTVDSAIAWLVSESAKTDGMEIALDVSNFYATDPDGFQTIAGILSDIGAVDPIRKTDLGKALLPCAQAIHGMKSSYAKAFAQIKEVLS